MTLHAAKGLEFPVVFIAGCESGIIPYVPPDRETPEFPDEEQRLFYVGMTRARRVLYLTAARKRTLFGKTLERPVSPFIDSLRSEVVETMGLGYKPKPRPQMRQLTFEFVDD